MVCSKLEIWQARVLGEDVWILGSFDRQPQAQLTAAKFAFNVTISSSLDMQSRIPTEIHRRNVTEILNLLNHLDL